MNVLCEILYDDLSCPVHCTELAVKSVEFFLKMFCTR
jgi:hypothetical protein